MKDTNLIATEKYLNTNHEGGVWSKNTDDNGMVDMIILLDNVVWMYSPAQFESIKKAFLADEVAPISEPLIAETSQGSVSEDFVLKLMAITQNKEKHSEL